MGKLANTLACLGAAAAAGAPIERAAACSPVSIVAVSSEMRVASSGRYQRSEAEWTRERELRRACSEVHPTNERFLLDVRGGRYDGDYVGNLSWAYENGEFGCERNPGFAFQLLDATIPEPVPYDLPSLQLRYAAQLVTENRSYVSRERYRQVVGLAWLQANSHFSLAEQGWSEREIERFLQRPGNWDYALAHFGVRSQRLVREADRASTEYGTNPDRDATVFRQLTDPASPRFDRDRAVSLVRSSGSSDLVPAAIHALLDPALGTPDVVQARELAAAGHDLRLKLETATRLLDMQYGDAGLDAAQSLLTWYSPYVHYSDEPYPTAAALWQVIGSRLAVSDDPQARARGEGILRTGDPQAGREALPAVSGTLVVLDRWPASLPAIDYGPVERWAGNYPARAVRDELGGLAGLSLLFGPDGAFRQVRVSRPSGAAVLDEAAATGATRYFRPRLNQLRLDGFAGSYVLVPLVEVEWHMGPTAVRPVGATIGDGRIVVTEQRVHWQSTC